PRDWSSDVCSSDLAISAKAELGDGLFLRIDPGDRRLRRNGGRGAALGQLDELRVARAALGEPERGQQRAEQGATERGVARHGTFLLWDPVMPILSRGRPAGKARYAVMVSLCPFALSDAARPAFSADFM